MKSYSHEEIVTWERFYKANFINCLTGFKSASLIGTSNSAGRPNLAIFSSIIHIGSNPPLIGYINRPVKAAPHTLSNIESTGVYTLNHIHASFTRKAHQTSAKYETGVNEFEETGLTEEYMPGIPAPFVKESNIKYALSLEQIIPIPLNNTFLVIGKIISIYVQDGLVTDDGFIHIEKAGSVCCNGNDGYYSGNLIERYAYAKPGVVPEILPGAES